MNSISIKYTLKFELSFAPQYKWTACGKAKKKQYLELKKELDDKIKD